MTVVNVGRIIKVSSIFYKIQAYQSYVEHTCIWRISCQLCGEKFTLKNKLKNHTEKAHTKKADSETEFTCSDAKHARNAVENIVTLPQTTQTNWRNTREAHMNKSHEIEHKEASVEPNV